MTRKKDEKVPAAATIAFLLVIGLFVSMIVYGCSGPAEVWTCKNCGSQTRMSPVHLPKSPALYCSDCGEKKVMFSHNEKR